jgi:Zn-dependent peptidase ImmA (M78 family)
MTTKPEGSIFDCLMTEVAKILAPMLEAARLRTDLNVSSLEETCFAVERAGYEIHRVDLPSGVRGAAAVDQGQPYILTNRCDCCDQHRYTVAHELGHHVLHMNPSPGIVKLGLANRDEEDREAQADQFAVAWFMNTATPEQRDRFLQKNPQVAAVLTDSMMAVVMVALPFLILYLFSRLSKSS